MEGEERDESRVTRDGGALGGTACGGRHARQNMHSGTLGQGLPCVARLARSVDRVYRVLTARVEHGNKPAERDALLARKAARHLVELDVCFGARGKKKALGEGERRGHGAPSSPSGGVRSAAS